MSLQNEKTDMGGKCEVFQTTRWSEIYRADTTDDDRRNIIIGALLEHYWKPVYCYLHRRGYQNESAKDLTQGFFHDIVLNGTLLKRASHYRGRFRTFLLTALDCYLTDHVRKSKAKKRSPKGQIVSLEAADVLPISDNCKNLSPEQIFNYAWATQILDRTIYSVCQECMDTGKDTHWNLFSDRILKPILENSDPPALNLLCKKYSVDSEAKASNMIITVKRSFRRILTEQLGISTEKDSDIESEYHTLMEFLSRGAG